MNTHCSGWVVQLCVQPCWQATHPSQTAILPQPITRLLFYFAADLVNVFETFLPQLLLYPNAADPLNGEAAALHMRDPAGYLRKVKGVRVCVAAACGGVLL
jgi:hypothetical protein